MQLFSDLCVLGYDLLACSSCLNSCSTARKAAGLVVNVVYSSRTCGNAVTTVAMLSQYTAQSCIRYTCTHITPVFCSTLDR